MRDLLRDLRLSLRFLARAPGYAAVVVAVLAVAIGASTALFSVVDGVLLRPLPYRDPDRLVTIWSTTASLPRTSIAYPDFLDWRERSRSFEGLAAFRTDSANVTGLDHPERIDIEMFSAGLLHLLGVNPLIGREFSPDEDRAGGPPVAMVHESFWRARMGGDPGVVGRTISLDGRPHTIVGVLPEDFRFGTRRAAVAVPIARMDPSFMKRGRGPGLFAVGRLAAGVTLGQARDEMSAIGRALGELYPQNRGVLPLVTPMRDDLVREVRVTLLLLLGAVLFLLLIAIANTGNLALARGLARQRELAIRAALGASRARLIAELLVESSVLALLGGAVGVVLAVWGVDVLAAARPPSLPRSSTIEVSATVLAFAATVSLASGILFGLAPALALSDTRLSEWLRAGELPGGGRRPGNLRALLVVAEVALSFILVTGAGLAVRAFVDLRRTPLGFDPAGVLTFNLRADPVKYASPEKLRVFHDQVRATFARLPAVKEVALAHAMPFVGDAAMAFKRRDDPWPDPDEILVASYCDVTPGFQEALAIPLLAGRRLTDADRPDAPPVVVVDEVVARRLFPEQNPLGKWLSNLSGKRQFQIVGVVPHVTNQLTGGDPAPFQLYFPIAQVDPTEFLNTARDVTAVVRTRVPPMTAVAPLRQELAALDPDQPMADVRTLEERVADALGPEFYTAALLSVFAGIALILAMSGLYAVMSYSVSRRTHEIGVRMALGAPPAAVQWMIIGYALRLTGLGLAVGLVGAIALAAGMSALVPGGRGVDPSTHGSVALALALVGVAAAWIPSRRAVRVDPSTALREP